MVQEVTQTLLITPPTAEYAGLTQFEQNYTRYLTKSSWKVIVPKVTPLWYLKNKYKQFLIFNIEE